MPPEDCFWLTTRLSGGQHISAKPFLTEQERDDYEKKFPPVAEFLYYTHE